MYSLCHLVCLFMFSDNAASGSTPTENKKGEEAKFYDKEYFDSDSDEEMKSEGNMILVFV